MQRSTTLRPLRRTRVGVFWFAAVSLLVACLTLIPPIVNAADSTPPPGLTEAAVSALKKFLPALDSPTMKQDHGFAAEDDFSDVSLGEPFEPQYLRPDDIGKYAPGKEVESVLTPSRHWFFPVRSHGKLACFLSVIQRRDGTLLEDKLGMAQLARVWAMVTTAWPPKDGKSPVLVIVPTHQRFYFTVPGTEPPNLTQISIEQADTATPETFKTLVPADRAVADLRERGSSSK